jgi:hypothetical protein
MSAILVTGTWLSGLRGAYIGALVFVLLLAGRACFVNIFIDESEPSYSDEDRLKRGWKATRVTRPIVVGVFLLIAAFIFWRMLHSS